MAELAAALADFLEPLRPAEESAVVAEDGAAAEAACPAPQVELPDATEAEEAAVAVGPSKFGLDAVPVAMDPRNARAAPESRARKAAATPDAVELVDAAAAIPAQLARREEPGAKAREAAAQASTALPDAAGSPRRASCALAVDAAAARGCAIPRRRSARRRPEQVVPAPRARQARPEFPAWRRLALEQARARME